MTREEMMQAIIEKFGFEDFMTIIFCMFAENPNNNDIDVEQIFKEMMTW